MLTFLLWNSMRRLLLNPQKNLPAQKKLLQVKIGSSSLVFFFQRPRQNPSLQKKTLNLSKRRRLRERHIQKKNKNLIKKFFRFMKTSWMNSTKDFSRPPLKDMITSSLIINLPWMTTKQSQTPFIPAEFILKIFSLKKNHHKFSPKLVLITRTSLWMSTTSSICNQQFRTLMPSLSKV